MIASAPPASAGTKARKRTLDNIGVVEWFLPGEYERVERLTEMLLSTPIRKMRTGISWADFHDPEGQTWYDWLVPKLASRFDLLPCVTYTPPSLGIRPHTASPPRRVRDYADFLDSIVSRYGAHFDWIELWNEPNNLNDWNWHLDHQWVLFSEMIGDAAHWMQARGKNTVLGGMCPTDLNWLALMCERGTMRYIDAVSVHAFPGTWTSVWHGWRREIDEVRNRLEQHNCSPAIWITEAGYSTWRWDEAQQVRQFVDLTEAPADRAYWYSLEDLHPARSSQEGFHFDERHYHTGLIRSDGTPKLLFQALRETYANDELTQINAYARGSRVKPAKPVNLITGGCGFIGCNLAHRIATEGRPVLIYDNLSRPGVINNAEWLKQRHGDLVEIQIADLRDHHTLCASVRRAERIFHLAAQVAVTTSLADPMADFQVNTVGTLNLLEAVRAQAAPPPLVFASTNKLYGHGVSNDQLTEGSTRYEPHDRRLADGTAETTPIELVTPYGCSKGAADQYVLDYARMYGLRAVVFRMSCIYGPRQLGTEDQGWIAHFLKAAGSGEMITIYGDGKQVRDVLYIDDAVDAYLTAQDQMPAIAGNVFNLGGGPSNSISLIELLAIIQHLEAAEPEVRFAEWRPGDQRFYISDTRLFTQMTGWRPQVTFTDGIARLHRWLRQQSFGASGALRERLSA